MNLTEQLDRIREVGFAQMPKQVAKVLLDGIEEVAKSNLTSTSLKKGDQIPQFELVDIHEERKNVKDLMTNDYLIINFYRGGWCPYCNLELKEYERLKDAFEAVGASIVAISPEKPEYTSITSNKNAITFDVLSDENATIMKEFGIVFQLNEKLKKEYTKFGIDLTDVNGNNNFELPIPATYIINKDLEIVFSHIEVDYTTRLEPSVLIEEVVKAQNEISTEII